VILRGGRLPGLAVKVLSSGPEEIP
jgi:hypothetical protein